MATGATLVDVRGPGERVPGSIPAGSVSCPLNMSDGTIPLQGLPADKNAALIVFCARGGRAARAIEFLNSQGYKNCLNGGGNTTPAQWDVLMGK
eukprot:CAMPEP_0178412100 /NCGR_PEP_ID=MMETSP0689_2-20121128/21837_1 /TAXON_ID=160604 /ORGANISM="Amphidinium massartii, Strain CS-259" /LENGTH=93 /DNA_ID=CAMNT_0020033329 /DNA_START=153 /DNA_END=434 /DNA_ORIENTATION=-